MTTPFLDGLKYFFLADLGWCLGVDVSILTFFGVFRGGQVVVGALRQVQELVAGGDFVASLEDVEHEMDDGGRRNDYIK